MSHEYVSALAIVVVGVLKLFKIEIGTAEIGSVIMAIAGIWVMIRRYQNGDIKLSGLRK